MPGPVSGSATAAMSGTRRCVPLMPAPVCQAGRAVTDEVPPPPAPRSFDHALSAKPVPDRFRLVPPTPTTAAEDAGYETSRIVVLGPVGHCAPSSPVAAKTVAPAATTRSSASSSAARAPPDMSDSQEPHEMLTAVMPAGPTSSAIWLYAWYMPWKEFGAT
jgi:hypothetical protein